MMGDVRRSRMSMSEIDDTIKRREDRKQESEKVALAKAAEIEKQLIAKGIWFTISRVYEKGLKFIKFDASIKVE